MNPDGAQILEPATISRILACAARRLEQAGIETARLDAKVLLLHALGVGRETLTRDPDAPVGPKACARFDALISRRVARVPVSQLTGGQEFWSLPFALSADTLIPRPDSETVVETALAALPDRIRPYKILDLGTGSGCLLLVLLSERAHAWGLGTDLSPGAVMTAAQNASALGLGGRAAFLCADWSDAVYGKFDLIVSNPPYIPSRAIEDLQPEVACHEPRRALDGGEDGLDAYRRIALALPGLLAEGGRAVLELGADQDGAVRELLEDGGLVVEGFGVDLAGRRRCVLAHAAEKSIGKGGSSG